MTKGELFERMTFVNDECEVLLFDDSYKEIIPIYDVLYDMDGQGNGRMIIYTSSLPPSTKSAPVVDENEGKSKDENL